MIDAGPSLKAAEGLKATDVLAYLVGNGWSARPSRVDGISILSKHIPGADRAAEFILPVKPGFEEEQRRVADALRTIEAVEERPMSTIVNEIRQVADQGVKKQTGKLPDWQTGKLPDWYAQLLRAEIKRIKDHEKEMVDSYRTVEYELDPEYLPYVEAGLVYFDCSLSTFCHALLHVRENLKKNGMIEVAKDGGLTLRWETEASSESEVVRRAVQLYASLVPAS